LGGLISFFLIGETSIFIGGSATLGGETLIIYLGRGILIGYLGGDTFTSFVGDTLTYFGGESFIYFEGNTSISLEGGV
jgi:hypothetical protein